MDKQIVLFVDVFNIYNHLEDNKHDCVELQKDVNFYGINNFRFEIILNENNLNKRLKLEKEVY